MARQQDRPHFMPVGDTNQQRGVEAVGVDNEQCEVNFIAHSGPACQAFLFGWAVWSGSVSGG